MEQEESSTAEQRPMGKVAARGALFTFAGQGTRILVQAASIFVLARLLAPADYGLTVMVTAIIGVSEVLRDLGLSSAAVQAKTLSLRQRSNLFWINTALGTSLTALVFFGAPLLAGLYDDERLIPIAQVLSFVFFVNGISTQHRASLARSLNFGFTAVADVASQLFALAAAVTLAVLGAGYWALVAQQLGGAIVAALVVMLFARWAPRGYYSREPMKGLLSFGLNVTGAQLLTYSTRNVDSIAIGYFHGPTSVGLYDRAFQLLLLPLNQLIAPMTRVAVPVLSRLQDDRDRYVAYLLRGQSAMLHAIIPIFAFGIATAPFLVPFVLGAQWQPTALLFQVLGVAGIARAAGNATHWVSLSLGLPQISFHLALISAPVTIGAILLGVPGGPLGVACAVAAASVLLWPFGLWWYSRRSDAPCWLLFTNSLRAVAGHGLAALLALVAWLAPWAAPLQALAAALIFLLVEVCLLLLWRRYRTDILQVLSTLKQLRR